MIVGGFTTADYSGVNSVEIVDIETKMSCSAFPGTPVGFRGGAGGLVDNQTPLVCAGYPNQGPCYLYKNGGWSFVKSLLSPRAHFLVLPGSPFGNPAHKFYVIGGDVPVTGEVFDGKSFAAASPSLPFVFYVSCAVYLNASTVMLIAGQQGSNAFSVNTYLMSSNTLAWVPVLLRAF